VVPRLSLQDKIVIALWVLLLSGALPGCVPGDNSKGAIHWGADGSIHPDATAEIAGYTGQGHAGQGWAGNSSGEGGPSAVPPAANDHKPR
jgi:hypothetical protein